MKNVKSFFLGIFYLIPTTMMVWLAYTVFFDWKEQYELGIIAILGALFLGSMSYTAFSYIGSEETLAENDDVPVSSMLVQKSAESCAEDKKYFCPYCGKKIENDWKFCNNCGKELKWKQD